MLKDSTPHPETAAKAKALERQGITQALSGSPASFTRGHKGVKPASYLSVTFFESKEQHADTF